MRDLRIYLEAFDVATHERMVNWSRCVRWGGPVAGRCASIEGRYRRTIDDDSLRSLGDEEERRRPAAPDPDHVDGLLIERLVCNPTFPKLQHALLAHHYVYRSLPRVPCKLLAIPPASYDREVCRAILMVRNRLELDKAKRGE